VQAWVLKLGCAPLLVVVKDSQRGLGFSCNILLKSRIMVNKSLLYFCILILRLGGVRISMTNAKGVRRD